MGTGTGRCPGKSGRCYVGFFGQKPKEPDYLVVDTDYENYSVVYSCSEDATKPQLWYLSRTPTNEAGTDYESIARAALPNFDFSTLVIDTQGGKCKYATCATAGS